MPPKDKSVLVNGKYTINNISHVRSMIIYKKILFVLTDLSVYKLDRRFRKVVLLTFKSDELPMKMIIYDSNIYISFFGSNSIKKYNINGNHNKTYYHELFRHPYSMYITNNLLYVYDIKQKKIFEINEIDNTMAIAN